MHHDASESKDTRNNTRRMTCPMCQRGRLDLRLRCDLSLPTCVLTAHCDTCSLDYLVDKELPSAPDHEIEECSRCGGDHLTLAMHCDTVTRRCSYAFVKTECRSRL